MRDLASFKLSKLWLLIGLGVLASLGCSSHDDMRIDASGTVSINGKSAPDGTLVLTPNTGGQMPVASRIHSGKFAFDSMTGPLPGAYTARFNPDEATIEEISEAAERDPRKAAREFNINRASTNPSTSARPPQAEIVIGDEPQQTLTIDLK